MAANKNVGVEMWQQFRKPSWPCDWCGRQTSSKSRTCSSCWGMEASLARPSTDEHALPFGRWVTRPGGVQVFVPGLRQPTADELSQEWAS